MTFGRRRRRIRRAGAGEAGFTVLELIMAMLLFSIVIYASLSLVSSTSGALARTMAEYESRRRVLLLQREMAEGTGAYAGYLAASNIFFGPGTDDFAGACVFEFEFPAYDDASAAGKVAYIWWPEEEVLEQSANERPPIRLLDNVAGFSVTSSDRSMYTIRVEIAHRVKGFAEPIVRATEGQVRNMDPRAIRDGALRDALKECPQP